MYSITGCHIPDVRRTFITHWNGTCAFFKPTVICTNWNTSWLLTNFVFHLLFTSDSIRKFPELAVDVQEIWAHPWESTDSCISRTGYEFRVVNPLSLQYTTEALNKASVLEAGRWIWPSLCFPALWLLTIASFVLDLQQTPFLFNLRSSGGYKLDSFRYISVLFGSWPIWYKTDVRTPFLLTRIVIGGTYPCGRLLFWDDESSSPVFQRIFHLLVLFVHSVHLLKPFAMCLLVTTFPLSYTSEFRVYAEVPSHLFWIVAKDVDNAAEIRQCFAM